MTNVRTSRRFQNRLDNGMQSEVLIGLLILSRVLRAALLAQEFQFQIQI